MPLELLDSLNLPGDPAKPNEDSFSTTPRMAAVFDGATGLGERLMPGQSDAQWIAQFAARRLRAHADGGGMPRAWLRAAATDTEKSFLALRRRAPEAQYEIAFASMMMAALDGDSLDLLWLGDCAALVRSPGGAFHTVGETIEQRARERERAQRLAGSRGANPAAAGVREVFLPALRESRNRVNTGGGDWLFAPDPGCADHAEEFRIAVVPGARILLATDGFLALASDYERYTPETLFAAAVTRGLESLGEELRAVESADPEGVKFPRFKRSDDATALLLRVCA
jgi:serine/threonine protein phosphatase PrpC